MRLVVRGRRCKYGCACLSHAGIEWPVRTWRDIAASIVGIAMVRPLPVTIAVALLAAPVVGQEVAFGRDVLPILSDRCFRCHGPDAAARKAGLRLDRPIEAETARELVSRITALAPDRIMPPPDSNRFGKDSSACTTTVEGEGTSSRAVGMAAIVSAAEGSLRSTKAVAASYTCS